MTRREMYEKFRCVSFFQVNLKDASHSCMQLVRTCRSKKMLPLKKDLKYWTDSVSTQTSNTLSPFVVVICCSSLCFSPFLFFSISFTVNNGIVSHLLYFNQAEHENIDEQSLSQWINLNLRNSNGPTLPPPTTPTKGVINQQEPLLVQNVLSGLKPRDET